MIKKTPSDFRVEEVLDPAFLAARTESGPYALYTLEKFSLATPEAIGKLSRALSIPAGAFAYGGLKDKHARTIQHITLKTEGLDEIPGDVKGEGWLLKRLGFVERSITAAEIHRNRFTLTVRNLTAEQSADMEQAAALLRLPDEGGNARLQVVNYFGDQRFGSARHGQGFIGKLLCKGDFEGALKLAIATESRKDRMDQKVFKRTLREHWGDWKTCLAKLKPCPERKAVERLVDSGRDFRAAFCGLPYLLQQLSVYAYQSHLWNAIARKLIEDLCAQGDNGARVLAADDPFGEMLFPAADIVPPELATLNLPLLAKKTQLIEPWKAAAEAVLAGEGLGVEELHINGVRRPFFGEEPRQLFFTAERFELGPTARDEFSTHVKRLKRPVQFELPRGAYATVVLRALGQ